MYIVYIVFHCHVELSFYKRPLFHLVAKGPGFMVVRVQVYGWQCPDFCLSGSMFVVVSATACLTRLWVMGFRTKACGCQETGLWLSARFVVVRAQVSGCKGWPRKMYSFRNLFNRFLSS